MGSNNNNRIGIIIAALNINDIRLKPLFKDIINLGIDIVVSLPKGKGINYSQSEYAVIEQSGKGIYNALNSAIKHISRSCTHYIVCGDDDLLDLEGLKKLTWMEADLSQNRVYSGLVYNEKESCYMRPHKGFISYHLHKGLISEHSVGTLIPINLHYQFGEYVEHFKIAGDCEFLMRLYKVNVIFEILDFQMGIYNGGGLSNSNASDGLREMKLISQDLNKFTSVLQSLKQIKSRLSGLYHW